MNLTRIIAPPFDPELTVFLYEDGHLTVSLTHEDIAAVVDALRDEPQDVEFDFEAMEWEVPLAELIAVFLSAYSWRGRVLVDEKSRTDLTRMADTLEAAASTVRAALADGREREQS